MDTTFLELSSFEPGNPQGYADEPDFRKHIWPFIRLHAVDIKHVEYRSVNNRTRGQFVNAGPLHTLDEKHLEQISELSNWGGHLDVLYVTDKLNLIKQLAQMYPSSPVLHNDPVDAGIPADLLQRIDSLMDTTNYVFAFGHDGDPAYVFGPPSDLSMVLKGQRA